MIGCFLCLLLVAAGAVGVYEFDAFPARGEPSERTHKAGFAGRSCQVESLHGVGLSIRSLSGKQKHKWGCTLGLENRMSETTTIVSTHLAPLSLGSLGY